MTDEEAAPGMLRNFRSMANAQAYGEDIFVFVSQQNRCLSALTTDSAGVGLPIEFGPWHRSADQNLKGFAHEKEITAAIALNGFYLSRSDGVAW
jgi:hypothetical protein